MIISRTMIGGETNPGRSFEWSKIIRAVVSVAAPALFVFAIAAGLGGCAIASAPIKNTPKVVATPQNGEMTVSTQPSTPIGDVEPVYVSIANGTDVPREIVPSQIFALDGSGNRIAPLPPGEAARQAGGAGALKAGIQSAVASGVVEGAIGAGIGAVAGSLLGSGATGAALGGAIGGGQGALQGAFAGPAKAQQQADAQLTALALQSGNVRQNFTVSGYVFFPKGAYQEVELLLVNSETGDTEIIKEPWK
ncbi:MAG: hypothetical protein ACREQN_17265 [Candidatus Binataceae bacterium]